MWNFVQISPSRMFYNYDFLCHFITKGENIKWKSLKFCFVFAAKTHAVSLSIGSACRSIFLQTSHCLVGSSSELYPRVLQTIINISVCFFDVFQRNYFIFFHYSNPPSPDCRRNVDYKPIARHFEHITPFSFLTLTHRCTHFKPARLVILV